MPPSPADLAHTLFAAIEARDEARLEHLVHPDAELEMAMAKGELVVGRAAILATLRDAWQHVHTLRIDRTYDVSEEAVILEGRSRHEVEIGGLVETGAVWLCEYRDGMLWRQRLFSSVVEARRAPLSYGNGVRRRRGRA